MSAHPPIDRQNKSFDTVSYARPHKGFSVIALVAILALAPAFRAHATSTSGIDTAPNNLTLPFSISGTPYMTLTATGLTVSGAVNTSGNVIATGAGVGVYGENTGTTGWGGYFTGVDYGMYGSGNVWAGYFQGPVNITETVTIGSSLAVGNAITIGTSNPLTNFSADTLYNLQNISCTSNQALTTMPGGGFACVPLTPPGTWCGSYAAVNVGQGLGGATTGINVPCNGQSIMNGCPSGYTMTTVGVGGVAMTNSYTRNMGSGQALTVVPMKTCIAN